MNVLDRINKIDKIGDDENPDNPVNPVKKDYQHKAICGESVENVANVKMLPNTNTNCQLGSGNVANVASIASVANTNTNCQ